MTEPSFVRITSNDDETIYNARGDQGTGGGLQVDVFPDERSRWVWLVSSWGTEGLGSDILSGTRRTRVAAEDAALDALTTLQRADDDWAALVEMSRREQGTDAEPEPTPTYESLMAALADARDRMTGAR